MGQRVLAPGQRRGDAVAVVQKSSACRYGVHGTDEPPLFDLRQQHERNPQVTLAICRCQRPGKRLGRLRAFPRSAAHPAAHCAGAPTGAIRMRKRDRRGRLNRKQGGRRSLLWRFDPKNCAASELRRAAPISDRVTHEPTGGWASPAAALPRCAVMGSKATACWRAAFSRSQIGPVGSGVTPRPAPGTSARSPPIRGRPSQDTAPNALADRQLNQSTTSRRALLSVPPGPSPQRQYWKYLSSN